MPVRAMRGASACTLLGMSGVGKTQVAVEYVYRFRTDYDLVWWINSDRISSAAVSELAVQFGLRIGSAPSSSAPFASVMSAGPWSSGAASGSRHARHRAAAVRESIGLLLGLPGRDEAVGRSPVIAVVVETDGAIEQVDWLKTACAGASTAGLAVFRRSCDGVLEHAGVVVRQLELEGLVWQCRECPMVGVCGNGSDDHRHRVGEGFRNPSVYCGDLERLI